jgi:hypothetical protein
MNSYDFVFCSLCGNKYSFSSKCCERPTLSSLTNKEVKNFKEQEEINYLKKLIKYCVWCGTKVKWNGGKFIKTCKVCDKNVMGGKLFRLDESLSFCENCGQKVFSRNDNCTCGYLPIQNDNSLLEINSNLIFPYEKKYCKDCGKSIELISDFKEDIVNEETGEVITVFPHFCNLKSPTYP